MTEQDDSHYERRVAVTLPRSNCWTISPLAGRPRKPTAPSRPPVTDLDALAWSYGGPADAAAGERVFFHTKGPGCYRCHQVKGRGSRAGPDLSTLAAGMNRRRLVESILTPSKEIAPQFVAWSVALNDGTVFSGHSARAIAGGIAHLRRFPGPATAVKNDDIAERKPQSTSIMPDNLCSAMTLARFSRLVAFLWRRK